MDTVTTLQFLAGFVLLVAGAEVLVRGAASIATGFGISPVIVGLTVVAFGTSASELSVSIMAASRAQPDLAFGNVVGSSICNVLLILGLAALVTPLTVDRAIVRREGPLMLGSALLMGVLALDHELSRLDGLILFSLLLAFIGFTVQGARKDKAAAESAEAPPDGPKGVLKAGLFVLVGLAMLVGGSEWLVKGAVSMARTLGVSELIIGLTVVSIGTSLPEIATTVVAALRGQRDLAVGNVVGSNIFNVLCVLGLTAIVAPRGIQISPNALYFDLPIMIAACAVSLPIFFSDYAIERWEGGVLFGAYIAYVAYLALDAQGHAAVQGFGQVMLLFAVPLSVMAVIATAFQSWRRGRSP